MELNLTSQVLLLLYLLLPAPQAFKMSPPSLAHHAEDKRCSLAPWLKQRDGRQRCRGVEPGLQGRVGADPAS